MDTSQWHTLEVDNMRNSLRRLEALKTHIAASTSQSSVLSSAGQLILGFPRSDMAYLLGRATNAPSLSVGITHSYTLASQRLPRVCGHRTATAVSLPDLLPSVQPALRPRDLAKTACKLSQISINTGSHFK